MELPDDILLRILQLAASGGELPRGDVMCVCQKWRRLLCASYQLARLVHLAPGEGAALATLHSYPSVTHVQLGGDCPAPEDWGGLLRTLATEGAPLLTSVDFALDHRREVLEDFAFFLSQRTRLQCLQLRFPNEYFSIYNAPEHSWQAMHADLEALDFGALPHLEFVTLDLTCLYNDYGGVYRPDNGCCVPLSRTLVTRQQQQQKPPSQLKAFHLLLSSEAQTQVLPPWLSELQPFSSLSMICSDHTTPGSVPVCYSSENRSLFRSLAAMATLQELSLHVYARAFGADELAAMAELPSLTALHLWLHDRPLPQLTRALPRLKGLSLNVLLRGGAPQGPAPPPDAFFAFTPNLRVLELRSILPMTWPPLASLTELEHIIIDVVEPRLEPEPEPEPGGGSQPSPCSLCHVAGLPALRHVELASCELLPFVSGLSSVSVATAVTVLCQCPGGRNCAYEAEVLQSL